MVEATTKKAMRRRPASRRGRSLAAMAWASPVARRHLGQLGGRHGHAEQADGQQVQHLGVAQAGHGPGRQEADDGRVDPAGDLQDPAAQHHRDEAAAHLGHLGRQPAQAGAEAAQQIQRHGQLHQQLQGAAGDRAPGGGGGQRVALAGRAAREHVGPVLQHQRGDDGRVPQHRRDVGQEEAAVAVQHAQAPGRQHQDAGAGEHDAHQAGCRPRASRRGSRRRTRPPAAAPPARPPAPAPTSISASMLATAPATRRASSSRFSSISRT